MKTLITALSLLAFASSSYAAETIGEKATAKTNDMKRSITKSAHRMDEKICDKTDKSCLAKKVNNRGSEVKNYTKDKAAETENMIND